MKIIFGKDRNGHPVEMYFDLIHNGKVDYERDAIVIWAEEMREAIKKVFGYPAVENGVAIPLGDDSRRAVLELDDPLADKNLGCGFQCANVKYTHAEKTWIVELW